MKKKTKKIIAALAVLCCAVCATACGREIPSTDNNSNSDFVVSGGKANDTDEDESDDPIKLVPRTTAVQEFTETAGTETETSVNNVSLATRSKEELDRINSNRKPASTKKTSGGALKTTASNKSTTATASTGSSSQTTTASTTTTSHTLSAPTIQLSYTSAEIIVGQTKQYALVTGYYDEVWTSDNENVATVDTYGNITGVGEGSCKIRVTDKNTAEYGEIAVTVIKLPDSLRIENGFTYTNEGNILIANKSYALPSTYNPGGLTTDTSTAFQALVQGAANSGISLRNASGFRSYEDQDWIYNNYPQGERDTYSARPGHSEHQTGMAIDVNEPSASFNGTPEAIWLKEHCVDYGFIIRYPEGKQHITGYKYEPWHIRYVGVEMAQKIRDAGIARGDANITLEEYFGIDSMYR